MVTNNTDRIIIATYLILTVMILLFHFVYEDANPSLNLRFGVRVAMFVTTVIIVKQHREQKIITLAFLCTVISDFFFTFVKTFDFELVNRNLYGITGFIVAYLFLIAAFQRNFKIGKKEIFTVLPFVVIFGYVLVSLKQYATGLFLMAAIVLGIVLCYAAMTMIATLYRGYFKRSIAWMIAVAGIILFLSDMVVAYSIFHPDFRMFILWKDNLVWGTYMIGWILLLMITARHEIHSVQEVITSVERSI